MAPAIPILILAAGSSTRMRGKDKLLEEIRSEPLLRRQAQRALDTGHPVYVALPSENHPRSEALKGLEIQRLTVADAAEGMSGTLRGAVAQLAPCPAFLLMLADLVDIDTEDLTAVIMARAAHPDALIWRGATADGKPGHPILFDSSLIPEFAHISGDTGGAEIVKAHRNTTCLVPLPGTRARRDLDTPEEWAAWRAANPT